MREQDIYVRLTILSEKSSLYSRLTPSSIKGKTVDGLARCVLVSNKHPANEDGEDSKEYLGLLEAMNKPHAYAISEPIKKGKRPYRPVDSSENMEKYVDEAVSKQVSLEIALIRGSGFREEPE